MSLRYRGNIVVRILFCPGLPVWGRRRWADSLTGLRYTVRGDCWPTKRSLMSQLHMLHVFRHLHRADKMFWWRPAGFLKLNYKSEKPSRKFAPDFLTWVWVCHCRFGLNIIKEYWAEHDESGEYPLELHAALAKDGWIGIALPEELGGAGLGISEATMMLQTISEWVVFH